MRNAQSIILCKTLELKQMNDINRTATRNTRSSSISILCLIYIFGKHRRINIMMLLLLNYNTHIFNIRWDRRTNIANCRKCVDPIISVNQTDKMPLNLNIRIKLILNTKLQRILHIENNC